MVLHDSTNEAGKSMTAKSEFLLNFWKSRVDLLMPYVEFDPNKSKFTDICKFAEKHGTPMRKFDFNEPLRHVKNMMWLKGSQVVMSRPLRDKRNEFIKDILIVGKDVKRNEIVLGMKKTYNNYTRIVPLYKDGLNLITSIRFMANNRPSKYPLIAPSSLDRHVQEAMKDMHDVDLVHVDFSLNAADVLKAIEA